MRPSSLAKALVVAALASACSDGRGPPAPSTPASSVSANTSGSGAPAPAPPRARLPASSHEGSMIARAIGEPALYVADEDARELVKLTLPLEATSRPLA